MNQIEIVIFNLQTISNIGRGKRISTAKQFIKMEEEIILQPYFRWRSGDSRDRAVLAICREVRLAIQLRSLMLESRALDNEDEPLHVLRKSQVEIMRRNLLTAQYGIRNLCETYDDENVSGNLLPLLNEIDHAMMELQPAELV